MDAWLTSLVAALGPVLAQALYDVGKDVVKPLAGPLAEQVRARVGRGYDARVDDLKLCGSVEEAVKATGLTRWEDMADYPLRVALDRLAGKGHGDLRRQAMAAALAMTDETPSQVPAELRAGLNVPEDRSPDLACFLWAFRRALAKTDEDYRVLVELAHEDEVRAHLRTVASTVVHAAGGPAQRVVVIEPKKPAAELRALEGEYRTYLFNTYRRLDFRGIVQTKSQVELPLAEVYVSLIVAPSGGRRAELFDVIDEAQLREMAEREDRLGVEGVLNEEPRLVVLGDPGGGKTTFLRYVALALAEGEQAARERLGLSAQWLPVYLPLAAYNEELRTNRVSLEDYVLRYWDARSFDRPGMAQLVAHALEEGRVLLLLDGLDEVGSRADRLAVARQVEAWANSYGPRGNRAVVASRIVGYDEAPLTCDFRAYTLSPFGPQEIERFAHQWCVAYRRWADPDQPKEMLVKKGRDEAAHLVAEIRADPKVESLASNPLLMTIIALIHYKGMRLPDHRVKLYDLCMQTLIETWREARSEAGPIGKPLRAANEIKVLAPLALWLQNQAPGPGGAARRDAVRAQLVELMARQFKGDREAAEEEADLFLELGQKQTGLLVERGEGWFGFFHPTFKEYLAARACVLEGQMRGVAGTWEVLRGHLPDAQWHEAILLTVGYKAIVESQDEAAAYLVQQIAAEPGKRGENVVLAGRCLADIGRGLVPDNCWEGVIAELIPVMQDTDDGKPNEPPVVPVATRYRAAETLDRLGWLPEDVFAWVRCADCAEGGGDLMAMKYPVTNTQYERFMQAEGCENAAWWSDEGREWRNGPPSYRGEGPVTEPEYWRNSRLGRERHGYPVVGVSWYEAEAYCRWLTGVLRRARAGDAELAEEERALVADLLAAGTTEVRLPSAAEWVALAGGEGGGSATPGTGRTLQQQTRRAPSWPARTPTRPGWRAPRQWGCILWEAAGISD